MLRGHAVDDLARGWNAMQQMTDGQKAEFWTTIVGGGASGGAAIHRAVDAARSTWAGRAAAIESAGIGIGRDTIAEGSRLVPVTSVPLVEVGGSSRT